MTDLGVERDVVETPREVAAEERVWLPMPEPKPEPMIVPFVEPPRKMKTSVFHFRLDDDLRAEVNAAAREEDRTVGAFVRNAIRKALAERKR